MKNSILLTISLSLLPSAHAQDSQDKINNIVKQWFEVETHQINSMALRHTFQCQFYSATPVIKDPTGETSVGSHIFYSNNGQEALLTYPTTDEPLPDLTNCLKPNLRITNQQQADELLEAINDLFRSQNMMDSGFQTKATKTDQGWALITEEFFDDLSGYVVKTNSQGQITSISYSLGL
ncbi:hypothetical protein [Vibrio sp. LaRot3]|uniref:hypothetical protein n=1 Tax=Vibrio sp. LaRot3 TaxID=2998829 RepID=UPI0022CDC24E|nr:hypothetical protein [Vibrio sp. LaRot3]MDA0148213.1 hypothetical protein [Vibrio sp. LaRot3]